MDTTSEDTVLAFFSAVEQNDAVQVRSLISQHRHLLSAKHKSSQWTYDATVELDAFKFLGAYIGAMTGLCLAILQGNDLLAKDLIDATLSVDDLDAAFGGGNTALHLATFLGARDVVRRLLGRGANASIKNAKGHRPMDVLDDEEMRCIFAAAGGQV